MLSELLRAAAFARGVICDPDGALETHHVRETPWRQDVVARHEGGHVTIAQVELVILVDDLERSLREQGKDAKDVDEQARLDGAERGASCVIHGGERIARAAHDLDDKPPGERDADVDHDRGQEHRADLDQRLHDGLLRKENPSQQ